MGSPPDRRRSLLAPPKPSPAIALGVTPDDKLGTAPAGLGLKVGDKAPAVTLDDAAGGKKSLAGLASAGPLYVIFYRGGWCPFCNLQMHELAKAKDQFSSRGVNLVAISVDVPTQEVKMRAKHEARVPLLVGPGPRRAQGVQRGARGGRG